MDAPFQPKRNFESFLHAFARSEQCFPERASLKKVVLSYETIRDNLNILSSEYTALYLSLSNSSLAKSDLSSVFEKINIATKIMEPNQKKELTTKCVELFGKIHPLIGDSLKLPDAWIKIIPNDTNVANKFVGKMVSILDDLDWGSFNDDSRELDNYRDLHPVLIKYVTAGSEPDPKIIDRLFKTLKSASIEKNPKIRSIVIKLVEEIANVTKIEDSFLLKLLEIEGSITLWQCYIKQWSLDPKLIVNNSAFLKYLTRDTDLLIELLCDNSFKEKFKEIIALFCEVLFPKPNQEINGYPLLALFHFVAFCDKFRDSTFIPSEVFHRIDHRCEIDVSKPFEFTRKPGLSVSEKPKEIVEVSGTQLWGLIACSSYFNRLATFGDKTSHWINTKAKSNLTFPEALPKEDLQLFLDHFFSLKPKEKLTNDQFLRMIQIAQLIGAQDILENCWRALTDHILLPYIRSNDLKAIEEFVESCIAADLPMIRRVLVEAIIKNINRIAPIGYSDHDLRPLVVDPDLHVSLAKLAIKYKANDQQQDVLNMLSTCISSWTNSLKDCSSNYQCEYILLECYPMFLNLIEDALANSEDCGFDLSSKATPYIFEIDFDITDATNNSRFEHYYNKHFERFITQFKGYPIKKITFPKLSPAMMEAHNQPHVKELFKATFPKTEIQFR